MCPTTWLLLWLLCTIIRYWMEHFARLWQLFEINLQAFTLQAAVAEARIAALICISMRQWPDQLCWKKILTGRVGKICVRARPYGAVWMCTPALAEDAAFQKAASFVECIGMKSRGCGVSRVPQKGSVWFQGFHSTK